VRTLNLKIFCSGSSLPYTGWVIFFHLDVKGALKEKPLKNVWTCCVNADGGHGNITATCEYFWAM
jgi:hypothetical protein